MGRARFPGQSSPATLDRKHAGSQDNRHRHGPADRHRPHRHLRHPRQADDRGQRDGRFRFRAHCSCPRAAGWWRWRRQARAWRCAWATARAARRSSSSIPRPAGNSAGCSSPNNPEGGEGLGLPQRQRHRRGAGNPEGARRGGRRHRFLLWRGSHHRPGRGEAQGDLRMRPRRLSRGDGHGRQFPVAVAPVARLGRDLLP